MIRYKLKQLIADREFKERRHITIIEIASASGVHRATLSKMLNQYGYQSSTDVLDKLCGYFDCEVGDVLEYVGNDS